MSSLVNALIGEYLVTDLLGAGGMGEVYRARHTHLGRVIAIKVLLGAETDPNSVRRFYSEATIQASMRHPGVAEYLGFYEYRGRPCILMEYVDGETLAETLRRRGALPPKEALRIAIAIAAVAAHFHKHGVLHRDIKSSNIKINSAKCVKVLDFGIARLQSTKNMTSTGMVVGTPGILAPEQVNGLAVSPATDVWQIGVLIYEMLTGRMPFGMESPTELYAQILNGEYPPISRFQSAVPGSLEKVVNRCLQKDPAKRFASGGELLAALQALEQKKVPSGPGPGPTIRVPQTIPLLRIGIVAASVIALIALVVVLRGYHQAAQNSAASACFDEPPSAASSADDLVTVTVDTFEGSAQVFCKEQLVGQTPFSLPAKLGDKIHVVLRREGYKDLEKRFDVTERQVYTFVMDRTGEP